MNNIDLQFETTFSPLPDSSDLIRWATLALEGLTPELTIRLVNSDEIQTLNRDYRNKDKPTNVLSFPFEAPPGIDIDLLGDIIICPQVVFEEAQAQGKPYLDHFAHILIHGVLHLLGYDHLEEQEAEQMESKEIGLLAELNIRNPYGEEFDHA